MKLNESSNIFSSKLPDHSYIESYINLLQSKKLINNQVREKFKKYNENDSISIKKSDFNMILNDLDVIANQGLNAIQLLLDEIKEINSKETKGKIAILPSNRTKFEEKTENNYKKFESGYNNSNSNKYSTELDHKNNYPQNNYQYKETNENKYKYVFNDEDQHNSEGKDTNSTQKLFNNFSKISDANTNMTRSQTQTPTTSKVSNNNSQSQLKPGMESSLNFTYNSKYTKERDLLGKAIEPESSNENQYPVKSSNNLLNVNRLNNDLVINKQQLSIKEKSLKVDQINKDKDRFENQKINFSNNLENFTPYQTHSANITDRYNSEKNNFKTRYQHLDPENNIQSSKIEYAMGSKEDYSNSNSNNIHNNFSYKGKIEKYLF